MKHTTTAIFLILMIALSQAANMRRQQKLNPMDQLQKVGEQSKFASNLYVTINLSLQSGGRVDEVIEFVKEAKSETISQRNDLTNEFKAESARLNGEIENLQSELNVLNSQLDITLENIDELTQELAILTQRLGRLQQERDNIESRQQSLETARENDENAFRSRQIRDTQAINALTSIIPALENLLENGSAFLEKDRKQILMALQRIPENKPIQMLVELSTKFNQAKLAEVIEKLAQILESIENSKAQDEQDEHDSNQRYLSLRSELEQLWHAKQKEINITTTDINSKEQSLRHNKNFKETLINNIDQTSSIKSSTQTILNQTTATYNTNFEAANEAVDALTAALQILTENEATLESQEEDSNNDIGAI